jgi:hydroxymethylglutaryl-CoA reductase (NADPH)
MGMNMVTIAAEAIGKWLAENLELDLITVAANVDSDKKPSQRTHDRGRGYEVTASATIPADVITAILKTTPEVLLETAHAKLEIGSELAGAIGHNCHAANIIAAIYLATGQDPAHVIEGSLADTRVEASYPLSRRGRVRERGSDAIIITTRLPAVLVGVRGGGTELPAQSKALNLLLGPSGPRTRDLGHRLHPCRRLAESIGAAVLAGELSLLAALSSHHLAQSHKILARSQ